MRWLVGATILVPGCFVVVDDGSDGGSGLVDEERVVDSFQSVSVDGRVDVDLSVADAELVVVHCPSHLVGNVTTDVVNGELHIDARPEGLFATGWGDCSVEVAGPAFSELTINGSGDLTASGVAGLDSAVINGSGNLAIDGLDNDAVTLEIRGSGDLSAVGTVSRESLTVNGSGDLDAGDLHAVNADVVVDGSGDTSLYATGAVTVELAGSGDVRISGDPSVDVSDHGSGDVILK